jgi:DNA (cytosine-5)-methyltransferase 1
MKSHMRYASVCDGIGAAHVAWQPLGWECAWTSEIEPFPAAVVDHHWKLKNLGDMTKLTEEMLNECGPISLLCGGTPCQSFSVAGLRKGLEDPRGNLALRFTQLVGVMRPEWVVWENVPGVLSSGEGRDFGAFLGALAELGYGFAYRILDAQWFGVAQRRRRVFVVANARDWRRAAAVLFERESLFGNPPTRGTERQRTSDGIGESSPTVSSKWAKGTGGFSGAEHYNLVAFQGGSQQDQVLSGEAVCPSLCHSSNGHKGHHQPKVVVPFTKAKRAKSDTDDESWVPGDVAPTQSCFDQGDVRATTVVAYDVHGTLATKGASETDIHSALRGRTPGQSEASTTTVVAFRDPCPTLTAKMQGSSGWAPANEDAHLVGVSQAFAAPIQYAEQLGREKRQNGMGLGDDGDPMFTLETRQPHGVAQAFTHSGYSNQPAWMTGDRTDCLPASGHGDTSHQGIGVVCGDGDTTGTIRSNTRNNSDPVTEAAMHVMHGMAVRRLTPKECERLQGFPDGYTDVTYRKKPAADGPRYRALGNSMAVPVMAWIGQRIAEVEATDGTDTK